jgi:anti-sigma B factor antagonist
MSQDELLEGEDEPISTEVRWDSGVCVVDVNGEVDLATIPILKVALDEAANSQEAALVNLSGVTYMDSSGFATLLEAARSLKQRGATLHLIGPNKNIARLMEITRLNTVFHIHLDEDTARTAVGLSALSA